MTMQHWASVWGNAVSVAENRPERYAKNITIRYPINIPFSGSAIRLTFDNYCGTEPITLTKTTVFHGGEFYPVYFGAQRAVTIGAGETVLSDPLELAIAAGEMVQVSFYLGDFTLMRSVVYTCGPLSQGLYANGDETETAHIPLAIILPRVMNNVLGIFIAEAVADGLASCTTLTLFMIRRKTLLPLPKAEAK